MNILEQRTPGVSFQIHPSPIFPVLPNAPHWPGCSDRKPQLCCISFSHTHLVHQQVPMALPSRCGMAMLLQGSVCFHLLPMVGSPGRSQSGPWKCSPAISLPATNAPVGLHQTSNETQTPSLTQKFLTVRPLPASPSVSFLLSFSSPHSWLCAFCPSFNTEGSASLSFFLKQCPLSPPLLSTWLPHGLSSPTIQGLLQCWMLFDCPIEMLLQGFTLLRSSSTWIVRVCFWFVSLHYKSKEQQAPRTVPGMS